MGMRNAYIAAGILDLIDYLVIGFIPIAGDAADIAGILAMHFITKNPLYITGLVEIIPGADILPTNLAITYAIDKGLLK